MTSFVWSDVSQLLNNGLIVYPTRTRKVVGLSKVHLKLCCIFYLVPITRLKYSHDSITSKNESSTDDSRLHSYSQAPYVEFLTILYDWIL